MEHVCQPTKPVLACSTYGLAICRLCGRHHIHLADCLCDLAGPNRCRASSGAVATLVVCEAVHMCMVARGVEKHASSTVTCAARGACKANGELRTDLLKILNSASFC